MIYSYEQGYARYTIKIRGGHGIAFNHVVIARFTSHAIAEARALFGDRVICRQDEPRIGRYPG